MRHPFRKAASVGLLTISGSMMLCGCQSPPFFKGSTASSSNPEAIREAFASSSDREELEAKKFVSRGRESGLPLGRPAADSPRVQAWLQQAHDAVVRGRADDARRLYQQVLDEHPDHAEAHHRLGILADREGQYATAEKHYLRALRGRPTDADLLSDLGYSYFLQGRPIESEKFLREALQVDPQHRHARDNLSVLFDRAKAESVLRTVQSSREVEQTLAALFSSGPANDSMDLNSETPPEGVDPNEWLRRKMAAARTERAASRPPREPSRPMPRPQQRPRPRVVHAGQGGRVPDEHLANALRDIDRSSSAPQSPSARAWPTQPNPEWPTASEQTTLARTQQRRTQQPTSAPRSMADTRRDYDQSMMAPPPHSSTQVAYGSRFDDHDRLQHADFDAAPPNHTTRYDMNNRDAGNPSDALASRNSIDSRPEAPRWENIPEQNWSQVPTAEESATRYASRMPQGSIQQTDYTAARQAAEMGMQTGPGAVFPGLRSSDPVPHGSQPRLMADGSAAPIIQPHGMAPPRRELPGSNSQTQGIATPKWQNRPAAPDWGTQDQYSSSNWSRPMESGANTPGQWPHTNGSANLNGMPVIQPNESRHQPNGMPMERRFDQNGAFQQNPGQTDPQNGPTDPQQYPHRNSGPLNAYDQQRQEHAATYNDDLQQLSTQRGQWGQGAANNRPAVSSGMMIGPNDYHSYRPEDFNLRPETGAPDYRAGLGHDFGTGAVPVQYPHR
ncbi:tetratricopeptide repeat protein [Thalassoroseus pseudoceratinae]|uniref:tetratricopeptide repeat protein n=1 Tax=Thalassoroseus pseudoceratinae TaxID=2713176 RepID=UPI001423F4CA|nr:tetratricopeptide repeat protein [Thalassoroseus pseudoceratinae]